MSYLDTATRQKEFTVTQVLLSVLIWSRACRVMDLSMDFNNKCLLENLQSAAWTPPAFRAPGLAEIKCLGFGHPLGKQGNAQTRCVSNHTGQHGQEGQIRGWLVLKCMCVGAAGAPSWRRLDPSDALRMLAEEGRATSYWLGGCA